MDKQIALRIDYKLYEEIKQLSDEDERSVNGEIEWLLKRALKELYGK